MHTSARRRARTSVTVAAVLSLSGLLLACSEDADPTPQSLWKDAQGELRDAGSGSFTFTLDAAGEELLRTRGSWTSEPDRSAGTTVVTDEHGSATEQWAADEAHVWRLPDGEPEGCWFENGPDERRTGLKPLPGVLSTVLESRATGWESGQEVVSVTGPVDGILQSLGDLTADVVLPEGASVDLEYTAMLTDGRITALSTDLGAVLRAVRDADGTVPEQLTPFLTEKASIGVLAGFDEQGGNVDASGPAASEVKDCDDPS